jgi:uncharacterized protein involved in exopolysaccharide biosynthesis
MAGTSLVPGEKPQETPGPVYVLTPADSLAFPEAGDQVSLLKYVNVLLKRRWLIAGVCFLAAAAAYAFSKMQPRQYEAAAVFVVAERSRGLAGEQEDSVLGTLGRFVNPIEYYRKVATSASILDPLLQERFTDPETRASRPLLDILKIEGKTAQERSYIGKMALRGSIELTNPRDLPNVMTLQVTAQSPQLAAELANRLTDRLRSYDVELKSANAKERVAFIDGQIRDTRDRLEKAEAALEQFVARNRVYHDPQIDLQRERLEREVNVQQEIFLTLKKEIELARIAEKKEASSISVVDRATPPRSHSRPRTLVNVALAGVVGFMMSVFLVFALEYWRSLAMGDVQAREFVQTLQDVKGDFRRLIPFGNRRQLRP